MQYYENEIQWCILLSLLNLFEAVDINYFNK